EYLQIISPANPSIDLAFASGSPVNIFPTLNNIPDTDDIAKLANFSTGDFVAMLQGILELLKSKDIDLLNQPLPLLDSSISDILAFTDPVIAAFDGLLGKLTDLKGTLLKQL